jgi:hypothetical protein
MTGKSRLKLRIGLFGAVVCAFGFLLWSRLLLVTRPPRVAMAHEPVAQPEPARAEPGTASDPVERAQEKRKQDLAAEAAQRAKRWEQGFYQAQPADVEPAVQTPATAP